MADIFISYSQKDRSWAKRLVDALTAEGWGVWWDLKIRSGESFDVAIERKLKQVRCVVVVWSSSAVESKWVRAEAAWAADQEKVVSIRIEDDLELPIKFYLVQTEPMVGWDGARDATAFRKLVEDINTVLGPSPTEEAKRRAKKAQRKAKKEAELRAAEAKRQAELKRKQEEEKRLLEAKEEAERLAKAEAKRKAEEQRQAELKRQQEEESEKSSGNGTSRKPSQVFRDTLKDGSKGPEMVVIPAGSFEMGSDYDLKNERPAHQVTVARFAMGKYPVTFEEYDTFTVASGREKPDDEGWGRGNRPVINVSWEDAKAYAEWLLKKAGKHYRLPTEAEWEYACRSGGKQEKYCGGDDVNRVAWYSENSGDKTHPVGEKEANGLGLYDMSGNVWEWVSDWYDKGYYRKSPRNNPKGPSRGSIRVFRGGSWHDIAEDCRSAYRGMDDPGYRFDLLGFRLARTNP